MQRSMHLIVLFMSAVLASRTAASLSFQPCRFSNFEQAVEHLSKAITFKTIGTTNQEHVEEFRALKNWLPIAYPEVWQQLKVEEVGTDGLNLLITWQGSDAHLKPVLFISHTDVVPVQEDTVKDWTHPPFSGAVADGYVWGRGTLDFKQGVIGLLEAATALLQGGYKPLRTLMLAFGHDEETGGYGAAGISTLLQARGVLLDMVWDEGVGVMTGGPLFNQPLALIGTSEKVSMTATVTVHSTGGHSSVPVTDGSSIAARMGRLLVAVGKNPPAVKLVPPTLDFVTGLSQIAPTWLKPMLWSVRRCPPCAWLVAHLLAKLSGETAAMVRTTAAVSRVTAGVADNVLPQSGQVKVNFRLLPGDTPHTAVQHIERWLGSDAQHATISFGAQKSYSVPVTDSDGPHFALLKAAVQHVWKLNDNREGNSSPDAGNEPAAATRSEKQPSDGGQSVAVLPYLLCGGTDSKHYTNLTSNILRFVPYSLDLLRKDVSRIHGTDERLSLDDFGRLLCTYKAGMQLAGMRMDAGRVGAAASRSAKKAGASGATASGAAADGEL